MKCLKKKPADRWQRADEILHQLEAMATPGTGTVPATPVQTTPVRRPWSKARVASVGAALAVVAALGYALVSGRMSGKTLSRGSPRDRGPPIRESRCS